MDGFQRVHGFIGESDLMLYQAFLDGSGKLSDNKSGHVALANLLFYNKDVDHFSDEWKKKLISYARKAKRKIPLYVKLSEALKSRGEFSGWRTDQVNECLGELATLTRSSVADLYVCCPTTDDYKRLPQQMKQKLGSINDLSFEVCLTALADFFTGSDRVYITCDDEEREAIEMYRLLNKFKLRHSNIRDRFVGICFVDDRCFPAVQAADLLAGVVRLEYDRRAAGEPTEQHWLYKKFGGETNMRIEYRWDDPGIKSPRPFKFIK